MYQFNNFKNAASFALHSEKPAFVFDGPSGGFVVAIGADARSLMADGHESYTVREVVAAVHGE